MKVHAILLSALAAAAMTAPADAGETKPSTIAAVEVTRNVPAGTFGGVAWRAIEGVIHGEASAAEPVAGLGALAAGRASVPYAIAFRIALPATASDGDAIVIEAPNRGNPIVARSLGAPDFAAVAGASPEAVAIGDGFLLRHGIALAALQWQAGLPGGPPESAQGIGEVACAISAAGSAAPSAAGRRARRSSAIASWPASVRAPGSSTRSSPKASTPTLRAGRRSIRAPSPETATASCWRSTDLRPTAGNSLTRETISRLLRPTSSSRDPRAIRG